MSVEHLCQQQRVWRTWEPMSNLSGSVNCSMLRKDATGLITYMGCQDSEQHGCLHDCLTS